MVLFLVYIIFSFLFLIQDLDGKWYDDGDQTVKIKADYVISAFGSTLHDQAGKNTYYNFIVKEAFKLVKLTE